MSRRLRGLLTLLAVSYFALWACAPIHSAPSPLPMPDGMARETGVAASGVAWPDAFSRNTEWAYGGGVDAYFLRETAPRLDLGVSAWAGVSAFVGVGGLARVHLVEKDRFALNTTVGIGWLHAYASLDFAFGLSDTVWVYVRPGGGARLAPVRMPVGLTVRGQKTALSFEVTPGWPSYQGGLSINQGYDSTRTQFAAGIAFSWYGAGRPREPDHTRDGTPLP